MNIEEELKKFLKDSRLNIDNNPAERLNRGIAIIRKNCLFAGSEAGGQRLAILYSFAATCKANGICFRKWLEDVLPRLNSTPAGQIDLLIPKGRSKVANELGLIIMKREMPSGGHHSPTAFILMAISLSKKSPLDPPSPWSWLGAYFQAMNFLFI
ncbi:MAG: transposase [Lentisphaeria bacterium]|nr:MAG: transposase [Lentisphaeria bacterium]